MKEIKEKLSWLFNNELNTELSCELTYDLWAQLKVTIYNNQPNELGLELKDEL